MSGNKNVFASKVGAILAAAGSAVGLGNVWRFPTEVGTNGGAAFILIYVLFMLVLGVPIMVTEFAIGRHGGSDVTDAFQKMGGGRRGWKWMGLIPVVSGFLILSYYAVVAGWTLYYAYEALMGGFSGKSPEEFTNDFIAFSSSSWTPFFWMVIIIAMTCGIVALGVQRGIERGAKIMMPLLFVFILVLVGCSLTLPNASLGLSFLFQPDFSKVTSSVLLSAMGQAFFSLSVGLGCLCTYACYFRKDVDLMKDGLSVASIDTLVALLSGLIIFPAVYSIQGLQPDAGPSLVFITLPNVFQQVFGNLPWLAYIFSLVFYLAAVLVSVVCVVLGTFCSLSFGAWKDVTLFDMGFFDLFDYIVAKLIMPIGGMLMCVFLGWVVDEKVLRAEMTNNGTIKSPLYPTYRFIIRYLAPIGIFLIFANELGLFGFLS